MVVGFRWSGSYMKAGRRAGHGRMAADYGVFTRTERSGRIMLSAAFLLVYGFILFFQGFDRSGAIRYPTLITSLLMVTNAFLLPKFRVGWWLAIVLGGVLFVTGILLSVLMLRADIGMWFWGGLVWMIPAVIGAVIVWACGTYGLRGAKQDEADEAA